MKWLKQLMTIGSWRAGYGKQMIYYDVTVWIFQTCHIHFFVGNTGFQRRLRKNTKWNGGAMCWFFDKQVSSCLNNNPWTYRRPQRRNSNKHFPLGKSCPQWDTSAQWETVQNSVARSVQRRLRVWNPSLMAGGYMTTRCRKQLNAVQISNGGILARKVVQH